MTVEQLHVVMEDKLSILTDDLSSLEGLVTGLFILVAIIGVVLAWRQRRIAKNQVELAELVRSAVGRLGSGSSEPPASEGGP